MVNVVCFLELAFRVAGLVYDDAGGDPTKRPKDFL
jgi:phosphoacetylglucosamine mutase